MPQAIRVPNHQHPRLPSPMRQHQPQPRRIRSHLKHRLTHHRSSPRHPRRQLHPVHPRRHLPPPALRIHQISPNQPLPLRLPALIRHLHRHPQQPSVHPESGTPEPPPPRSPRKHISSKHCGSPIATTLCRCPSETPITTHRYTNQTPASHATPRRTLRRSPRHSDTPTPITPIAVHPASTSNKSSAAFIPTPFPHSR